MYNLQYLKKNNKIGTQTNHFRLIVNTLCPLCHKPRISPGSL